MIFLKELYFFETVTLKRAQINMKHKTKVSLDLLQAAKFTEHALVI